MPALIACLGHFAIEAVVVEEGIKKRNRVRRISSKEGRRGEEGCCLLFALFDWLV